MCLSVWVWCFTFTCYQDVKFKYYFVMPLVFESFIVFYWCFMKIQFMYFFYAFILTHSIFFKKELCWRVVCSRFWFVCMVLSVYDDFNISFFCKSFFFVVVESCVVQPILRMVFELCIKQWSHLKFNAAHWRFIAHAIQ